MYIFQVWKKGSIGKSIIKGSDFGSALVEKFWNLFFLFQFKYIRC